MFVFLFHAIPSRGAARDLAPAQVEGADIYCWINTPHQGRAERAARRHIQAAGWVPGQLIDARHPSRTDYDGEPEALFYFDEALQQGHTLLINYHDDSAGSCPVHS